MSTAEILSLVSLISYIVAGICLVVTIFLWIIFKIPSVIGDLSGRTARKSIARMRANNEKAGGQGYKPSAENAGRGKLTDTMQHSKKLAGDTSNANGNCDDSCEMPETGVLSSNKAQKTNGIPTALLAESATTDLLTDENTTTLLNNESAVQEGRTGGRKLVILDEVILVHTDEVIS